MTTRDELIEAAAKAAYEVIPGQKWAELGTEQGAQAKAQVRAAFDVFEQSAPVPADAREALAESAERPTIALAREIAGWDQGNPGTKRIPHWAVNLAAHLLDKGYARRSGKVQAMMTELLAQAERTGLRIEVVYPQDAEPTDAEVLAGANGYMGYEPPYEDLSELSDLFLRDIRNALVAARKETGR